MKIKDLERTANVAWSPESQHPIYLAAGTAAQQLDASFNTNAALEIYSLNLTEPGPDMQLVSSIPSEHRFHRIIWGGDQPYGTIIGGCDGGLLQIYSGQKLLKQGGGDSENALVGKQQRHTGAVSALDFNPFQKNLFATGAGESEIFIWDLNHTSTPMSPGAKSQPPEDVLSIAWNQQVQHILASTFTSKCVIWDLRKNEPIIKLTDTVSRIRWKVVAWHPEVATQLCLASEEDHSPIIQLWDLRFATSPLKTLENHQRGVLSVAWCSKDPDLLVSCGKDNRIVCWNPNSNQPNGEILSEIAKTNQWSFDLAWCPKNPAIIASPNLDGHVSIYSLMGGQTQQIQTTNKIADSFPGMDGYVQAPLPQNTAPISVDLSKPPKWLKKPVGAKFGFSGKLISFEHDKEAILQAQQMAQSGQPMPQIHRTVQISQVVTEPELVQKSAALEKALELGNFTEYCLNKSDLTTDQHKKYIWHFLKANFESNPRTELLNLLGYRIEDINQKLYEVVGKNSLNNITDKLNNLNRLDDFDNLDNTITDQNKAKPSVPFKIKTDNDTDGLITQAILLNNVEVAVELCLKAKRYADALIIATTGGPDLLAKTQHRYLQEQDTGCITSLISAMISEDWGSVINDCDINSWKEALAAALTHASDDHLPNLCEQLGNRLERESLGNQKLTQDAQLCYICSGSFEKLVSSWSGNALNSTSDLQELIELVMFLQKAIERQGRQVVISGSLADLLSHYASLLAAQGDLKTALSYLGTTQNEKVVSLRERLYISSGLKPSHAIELRQQQSRRSSHRQSFSNQFQSTNPFNQQQTQPTPGPFGQTFNSGLPNAPTLSQPWQPQSFSPAPVAPPPVQPPRPASGGSASGGGLPSRKYLLDPSVSSNPYGGGMKPYNTNNNFPSNSPMYTPPQLSNVPNANPLVPNPNLNPAPLVPNPNLNPTPLVPSVGGGYGGFGGPLPPQQQQPNEIAQPAYLANNSPPGWNDPPVFSKSTRSQAKTDLPQPEPIRHPLYGTTPANGYEDLAPGMPPPTQPYNPTGYNNQPTMFNPTPIGNSAPMSSNFGSNFNPGNFNQNALGQQQQQPQVQEVRAAPEPVQKAPIPEEHIHMQTVFEELKNQCSCAASNPQTKRKLEDVGRKLQALYDLLREQKLSPNTLTSLHQMVQLVQNGDYQGGLKLHTQLVSGSDFAQIASFMPGLKVLLQCALQLQVYLR